MPGPGTIDSMPQRVRTRSATSAHGTSRALPILFALCSALGAGTLGAIAQEYVTPDDAARQLQASEDALEQARQNKQTLEQNVAKLRQERADLNNQLVDTAQLIQAREAKLTEIEERLGQLSVKEAGIRDSITQRHETIGKLLSAMQRIGRQPPPALVTRRDDALKMVRSAMLMGTIFPALKTQADTLSKELGDLVALQESIRAEQESLRAQNKKLAEERLRIKALLARKRARLEVGESQLARLRAAAERHAKAVAYMGDLLQRMDEEVSAAGVQMKAAEAEAERLRREHERQRQIALQKKLEMERRLAEERDRQRRLALERERERLLQLEREREKQRQRELELAKQREREKQRELELARKRELELRRKREIEIAEARKLEQLRPKPNEKVVELKPKAKKVAFLNMGRIKPALPFTKTRGALPLPAQGTRTRGFGSPDGFGGTSKGMAMLTRNDAQVTSPSDGWVVYAGPFRSYGQLLIINVGEGYHILLAGMRRIDVSPGQFVLAGEPVATMGASAAKGGDQAKKARPVLYVEFRKGGQPIDSGPWWAASPEKVQG